MWYHYGAMANMTVKQLPESVYRRLKKTARQQHRSLNAQVIQVLRDYVAEQEKLENIRAAQDELERFVASLPPMDDSTPLIREDRDREK
jgi:plasmid stability protein